MVHSSHRNPTNKLLAELLAMIADTRPEIPPVHKKEEALWENAAEVCAALDCLTRESSSARSAHGMAGRKVMASK